MSAYPARHENLLARRFSQVCIVALAALITSSIGLLAYTESAATPGWLQYLVLASGVMVLVSFAGWLVASLAGLARARFGQRH